MNQLPVYLRFSERECFAYWLEERHNMDISALYDCSAEYVRDLLQDFHAWEKQRDFELEVIQAINAVEAIQKRCDSERQ